jgi:hypothetical protein
MDNPTTPESQRVTGDARSRGTMGLVLVLMVGFIGVAVAKPWGMSVVPASPAPGPSSASTVVSLPSPVVTDAPRANAPVVPSPDVSTRIGPTPAIAASALIRWRLLAPDDSVSLVRSMLRSRGVLIAVGGDPSGAAPTTPIWTSRDGHTGSRCPSLNLCP